MTEHEQNSDLKRLLELSSDGHDERVRSTRPFQPTPERGKRPVGLIIATLVLSAFVFTGAAGLLATTFAPQWTEEFLGNAAAEVQQTSVDAGIIPPPVLILGGDGGQAELDLCNGEWTRMTQYGEGRVPQPVHSAHNGCGGNALLTLEMGETIDIRELDGRVVTYRAVDERRVPQLASTTADIVGMTGTLILQTCYWDDTTMRFVGLTAVDADPYPLVEAVA